MRGGYARIGFLLAVAVTVGAAPLFQNDPYLSSDPYSQRLADPNFKPRNEQDPGNKTIDQLITEAYGGLSMYMAESFLDIRGYITTELDMVLTAEQYKAMYLKQVVEGGRDKQNALVCNWPDKIIPYEFVTSHFNEDEVYYIKKAMDRWQETTCLKFRPYTSTDKNRIRFQNGNGCNSLLGMSRNREVQAINLQSPGCRYSGIYLHEIGHAIGLVHAHQMPDRDQYIYINYDNVAPSMRQWLDKYDNKDVKRYGPVPFEYSSVMHYGVQAFSKDGSAQTIRARDRTREKEIGRVYRKGLSFTDIKVVNLMYDCNMHCEADSNCKDPAYLDKNCKCVKPEDVTNTTTTTTTDGCYNSWDDAQCGDWASRDECNKNPKWMKDNCKKSCNSCTDTGTGKPDEGCTNIFGDSMCDQWANRRACESDPKWMRENCAKACNACEITCVDNNQLCEAWANSSYCTSNWYTQENCHKSCNACDKAKTQDGNNEKGKNSDCGASSSLHSASSVIFLLIVASFLAVKF